MKPWKQWLGERIADMKSTMPATTYERIGQLIREELRERENLDPTERLVLSDLEDRKTGKLGVFIGQVYRAYIKTKSE